MENITTSKELRAAIVALELKQKQEGTLLKKEFYVAYQKIQPINIIKNTLNEAINSSDLKDDLITASIGVGMGYLSKSLFEGETHSPTRKLMGTALIFGATNLVQQNPKFVKSIGNGVANVLKKFFYNNKSD